MAKKKEQLSREERRERRKGKSTLHRGQGNSIEITDDMEILEELEPSAEPPKFKRKSDAPDRPN